MYRRDLSLKSTVPAPCLPKLLGIHIDMRIPALRRSLARFFMTSLSLKLFFRATLSGLQL